MKAASSTVGDILPNMVSAFKGITFLNVNTLSAFSDVCLAAYFEPLVFFMNKQIELRRI